LATAKLRAEEIPRHRDRLLLWVYPLVGFEVKDKHKVGDRGYIYPTWLTCLRLDKIHTAAIDCGYLNVPLSPWCQISCDIMIGVVGAKLPDVDHPLTHVATASLATRSDVIQMPVHHQVPAALILVFI
jgi:hypothetical protein